MCTQNVFDEEHLLSSRLCKRVQFSELNRKVQYHFAVFCNNKRRIN